MYRRGFNKGLQQLQRIRHAVPRNTTRTAGAGAPCPASSSGAGTKRRLACVPLELVAGTGAELAPSGRRGIATAAGRGPDEALEVAARYTQSGAYRTLRSASSSASSATSSPRRSHSTHAPPSPLARSCGDSACEPSTADVGLRPFPAMGSASDDDTGVQNSPFSAAQAYALAGEFRRARGRSSQLALAGGAGLQVC
jgi:hypothetical protein